MVVVWTVDDFFEHGEVSVPDDLIREQMPPLGGWGVRTVLTRDVTVSTWRVRQSKRLVLDKRHLISCHWVGQEIGKSSVQVGEGGWGALQAPWMGT